MSDTANQRGRRSPESTYRVQLHAGFTFAHATAIVPYLHELGITHLYTSPILKARAGSMHGYDVTDHATLNPELGSDSDFDALVKALHDHEMGLIVDIVPNHMGVGTNENPWWNDVLENGPQSKYAGFFDIAWRGSSRPQLHDKVLLPVLGGPFGEVLERGELKVVRENDRYKIAYFDRRFPISPASIERFAPSGSAVIEALNGQPGDPRSFDRLAELLDAQAYRLSYWRVAPDEINYRRFFDINDLAALCMEKPGVFEAAHALILKLVDEGKIDGLRVDHPDGIFDPLAYFDQLQQGRDHLYVVAEKILAHDERLPMDWAVEGTTGYEFLARANGLFVDTSADAVFTQKYREWTGIAESFDEMAHQKKKLIVKISLASELQMLAHQLDQIAQRTRAWRDFTLSGLREALAEVIACFPVYRTYVTDHADPSDIGCVDAALHDATARNLAVDPAMWKFIRSALILDYPDSFNDDDRAALRRFAGKFQQVTAPVMAKSVEDTAFYVYNRLISLNEVGGDPGHFGDGPESLHRWLADRQQNWPRGLSPLSTHDTKRSEDVRARLNVLSEIPDEWWRRVARWSRLNEPLRHSVNGAAAPDPNEEYLIYQTLLGAWPADASESSVDPAFVRRIQEYMLKATREAKVHSSWTAPDTEREKAVAQFIDDILSPATAEMFLQDFRALERQIRQRGIINSLAQTLLRLTAPGVPDTYQGTELLDLSLVDPDNRRPVDYARRREALALMKDVPDLARTLLQSREDGRAKLFITRAALHARREYAGLFSTGDYLPLDVAGPRREHVFSFLRHHEKRWALIVIPRLVARLRSAGELPLGQDVWKNTELVLPPEVIDIPWRDRLTGKRFDAAGRLPLAGILSDFPVALLISE